MGEPPPPERWSDDLVAFLKENDYYDMALLDILEYGVRLPILNTPTKPEWQPAYALEDPARVALRSTVKEHQERGFVLCLGS
jgi:hypothetical protein